MLVGRRMTKDPKTVSPDASLAQAADIMRENRINHLPVVEGEKLVGILSDTDLRNASLASGGAPEGEEDRARERRVRDVMKTEVWSLTPEDSVEDALLIISRQRFGALPVLSGERLAGIITKIDLLNAFVDVLNLEEVGLRIEVFLSPDLDRFEELIRALKGSQAGIRSCVITPEKGTERMVALLQLDTIDGPGVLRALRAKQFEVAGPATLS
ncbi:MAG: CBS domain-containing protein [Deltaproteobacteria bacterium]|nr:CBS domain-containing protein [Deltaproteobacteria bacterium]